MQETKLLEITIQIGLKDANPKEGSEIITNDFVTISRKEYDELRRYKSIFKDLQGTLQRMSKDFESFLHYDAKSQF